uniref:Type II secretion system protein H n=1 Tax=Candidatus Kentrum sp. TUN TaxID=2126343 RepID=A0A451A3E5_9GAMM|nr:MAG: general secretion pathway protein H [Candidatus Kentron sp. TUN]
MVHRNNTGFTLLELMVVIVIVGIVSTMAIISLDFGGSMNAKVEAKRLVSLIRLAIDESIITGLDIGLELTPNGYRFLRYEYDEQGAKDWQVLKTDGVLHPRILPEIVTLALIDVDSTTKMEMPIPGNNDASWPQIIFLSTGEITPFQVLVSNENGEEEYRILGRWDGFVVQEPLK